MIYFARDTGKKLISQVAKMRSNSRSSNFRPWISSSHLVQPNNLAFSQLIDKLPDRKIVEDGPPVKLHHVVNLYQTNKPDLVQQRTVESMLSAKQVYDGSLELVNVQHYEDSDQTPNSFLAAPPLKRDIRSILMGSEMKSFPLLFDILRNGSLTMGDCDYVIYTNSDICVSPYFYSFVRDFIERGFDSFIINRRTLGAQLIEATNKVYLGAEIGEPHPGYDCFIIKKSILDSFVENSACIGVAGVAQGLLFNMVAKSSKFALLTNVSLTYHFGDDKIWKDTSFRVFNTHNEEEYMETLRILANNKDYAVSLANFGSLCGLPPKAMKYLNSLPY